MSYSIKLVIGIVLIIVGILLIIVTQLFLHKWLKNYNKEWENTESNEMSKL